MFVKAQTLRNAVLSDGIAASHFFTLFKFSEQLSQTIHNTKLYTKQTSNTTSAKTQQTKVRDAKSGHV